MSGRARSSSLAAESPADHCWHALQLLAGADRTGDVVTLPTSRAIALRNSLELALAGLGRPIDRWELTDAGRAALAMKVEP